MGKRAGAMFLWAASRRLVDAASRAGRSAGAGRCTAADRRGSAQNAAMIRSIAVRGKSASSPKRCALMANSRPAGPIAGNARYRAQGSLRDRAVH